ncbi:DinB family protein [Pedobacter sp.]|uniref:DinB family protein n=1 Tax=Pedobacter sp. TaxID=1411316 RepID=UPI003D7F6A18
MKITELIAQHIIEVNEGNNWTEVDVNSTLNDVTLREAVTLTNASVNTIASLVHHLMFWNRLMVQRINGVNIPEDEHNGYNVPQLATEEAWQQLKDDHLKSAQELATAIRAVDKNRLLSPILPGYSSTYKNLQGSAEHIHYHLGQIVLLKQLIRAS